jgi:HAD superfamily hydrolase (TIGR01509 family)
VLTLPSGDFDAFIFDCDGTLADSMPLYHRAWRSALARAGATFDFPWDLFVSRAGMSTLLTVEGLNGQFGTNLDAATIEGHQHAEYALLVDEVKPIDGVVAVAREFSGRLPMSVASGGTRVLVERTLEVLGIRELFAHVLVASDVPRGKPEPDLFLLAAVKMGVAPERCLVFEDGEPGILAAHRAGMQVVRVELGSRS